MIILVYLEQRGTGCPDLGKISDIQMKFNFSFQIIYLKTQLYHF